jgi:hypothetical protein
MIMINLSSSLDGNLLPVFVKVIIIAASCVVSVMGRTGIGSGGIVGGGL